MYRDHCLQIQFFIHGTYYITLMSSFDSFRITYLLLQSAHSLFSGNLRSPSSIYERQKSENIQSIFVNESKRAKAPLFYILKTEHEKTGEKMERERSCKKYDKQ